MKTHKEIYQEIYSTKNLILAWRKARKGKTKRDYVIDFEKNIKFNLKALHYELKYQIYRPKPLVNFILRDPKTRKISKSDFRDRIVHHALVRVIEPLFDKIFIYDSCANRKKKGGLFTINRFKYFLWKITKNRTSRAYCLKADIKHYFQEVDHQILIHIIRKKVRDKRIVWLIKKILGNNVTSNSFGKGMPLGNLTSQFFANVYLNELDYFVKHKLRVKFYIRYVDDFVLLHPSEFQLKLWGRRVEEFLLLGLKLELHNEKSRKIFLSKGIDFVGFRNFYNFRLLRKRNIRNMELKIKLFGKGKISGEKIHEIFQGWQAYARWANTYKLRKKFEKEINNLINHPLFLRI
jgi:retron-type reverse transcriptase